MPTAAFKEMEVTSLPESERRTVFHSSGTTKQKPSRHFHHAESLANYETSLLPWFARHLLPEQFLTLTLSPSERERKNKPGRGDNFEPTVRGETVQGDSLSPSDGERVRVRVARDFGIRIPATFIFLTPSPSLAPHSSLVHMFETVRREFGSGDSRFTGGVDAKGAWTLDLKKLLLVLRRATDADGPVIILGTAFNFARLLDHLAEANVSFHFPVGTRLLETGGYKGRSRAIPKHELYSLMTKHLGIPRSHIVSEYGMSELSSQGYDQAVPSFGFRGTNSHSETLGAHTTEIADSQSPIANRQSPMGPRAFHFPPWARAQIVSPETGREVREGETGLIRVFDLANVWSVMAIQTEDLGVRRGHGFELIGRAAQAVARGCSLMTA